MRNLWVALSLICIAPGGTFGQTVQSAPPAEFEVASIKPSQPSLDAGARVDPALMHFTNLSLSNYIGMAFSLKSFQLSGPDWIDREKFDIDAKIPAGQQDQFPAMMERLLEQRFQLKVHRETRILPVYVLVAASGGLKIHPNEHAAGPSSTKWGPGRLEAHDLPLSSLLGQFEDRPVVDATGIAGTFDFTLKWSEDANQGPSLRDALQEQLGLKLEPRKQPFEIVVVDSIARKPSEN
jgi:uncharacterized protein (TIGR03435 family)